MVKIEQDKALLQALLECDSAGTVLVKQLLQYQAGERLKPPKIEVKDNILTATAEVDSLAIYLTLKDRYVEKDKGVSKEEVRVVEINVLNGWQKFRLWIGNLILFFVPLIILLKIKKII